jgi:hypothetical protein
MIKSVVAASTILLFMLFTTTSVAGDRHRYHDRYNPNYNNYYNNQYYQNHNWRHSYYDEPHQYYRPLTKKELIFQINSQGFYWVYNIRPSHRYDYVSALAYNRRYGGRSVHIRINQYTGQIFYIRYN